MKKVLLIGLAIIGLSGCMTSSQYQMTPVAKSLPQYLPVDPAKVVVYGEGEKPHRPVIPIAIIGTIGNAVCDRACLEKGLQEKAAQLGADCVVVLGTNIANVGSMSIYWGHGISTNQPLNQTRLYGGAFKYNNVWIGMKLDKDGVVEYVWPDSSAEKSGIVEGDKVLTVDGKLISNDVWVLPTALATKSAGSVLKIEYLDRKGEKQHKNIAIEEFTRDSM
ncbi:MAG: PDZ domain-containing protein [Syntrophobacteraceae bacterium]